MTLLKEFIQNWMRDTGMSMTMLARRLGYKSKTSLDRLMNANTRPESLRKFESSMLSTFFLSEAQKHALHEAVGIAENGLQRYILGQEIWEFVRGEQPLSGDALIAADAETGEAVDLAARYAAASNIEATVLNCQYVPSLFGLLRALLEREDVRVLHYLDVNEDAVRTVSAVNLLMQLFYRKGYMGYACMDGIYGQTQAIGLCGADIACICYTDAAGAACGDVLSFYGTSSACVLKLPRQGVFERLTGLDRRRYTPVKRTYFNCSGFEDYIQYTRDYALLEQNCAVWKIKPDIGVDQIPVHILKSAMLRGCGEAAFEPGFGQTLARLEELYARRVEDTFGKKKHAYTIMKKDALRSFVRSGRTMDHFWMMAAYTLEERIEILRLLLEQQTQNPYIHMHLLKDEAALRDMEIAYYDHRGLLFLEADTDYHLDENHSEVLLTHPELLRLFREFYMGRLLKEEVLPEAETCRFLQQLIAQAEHFRDDGEREWEQLPGTGAPQKGDSFAGQAPAEGEAPEFTRNPAGA